jgi:acetyl-CoA carboxylase, biotin carboxylase subunit
VLKAAAGGGGRGITVVTDPAGIRSAYASTTAAALALFGDERVYVERYLERARHVEVQFACDRSDAAVHIGTRDCTVQRRYQKLLEEAPAPGISRELADEMCSVTLRAVAACGYVGLGTAEFLVTGDGHYHFLEVNCRIQVEHPVSEMVSGLDLVREQLHLASGGLLRHEQKDIAIAGHALECRVNAENPAAMFAPAPGQLERFTLPGGPFVRVDTHARAGYRIGADYDPLIAKVIVWAPDRSQALARMDRALAEFDIGGPGIATTIPFLRNVIADRDFRKAEHSTDITNRVLRGGCDSI